MVLFLPIVLAQELPPELRGRYVSPDVVEAWFSGETRALRGGVRGLRVSPTALEVDSVFDAAPYGVQTDKGDGRYGLIEMRSMAEGPDAFFDRTDEGWSRVTLNDQGWVRLEDALPAVSGIELDAISTASVLSRGWHGPKGTFVFLSEGAKHRRPEKKDGFEGGFGFQDLLEYRGREYVFQASDTLLLEEAAPADGMDRIPRDGGDRIELRPMNEPPFLIVADRLNLRERPESSAPIVDVAEGGSWVNVWQRRGDWLLVRADRTVGWGYAPFVARRLAPVEGRPEHGSYTMADAFEDAGRFTVVDAPDEAACKVGDVATPAVADAKGAAARLVNLDDAEPLDLVCLIEGDGVWVACPMLREGAGATLTPCGILAEFPSHVSSKKAAGGRSLVLGETEHPKSDAGWLDGVLPEKRPAPPPPPEPVPAADPGGSGALCATAGVLPFGLLWLVLPLVRRKTCS